MRFPGFAKEASPIVPMITLRTAVASLRSGRTTVRHVGRAVRAIVGISIGEGEGTAVGDGGGRGILVGEGVGADIAAAVGFGATGAEDIGTGGGAADFAGVAVGKNAPTPT